ncbi:hypothetical protein, partial [uncultured Sphingomonas sp.]|uniref:hypothetical protein n=1 Tax=uncultured Sphingomonas sp. TaxID=158754 RepID=UPI00262D061B
SIPATARWARRPADHAYWREAVEQGADASPCVFGGPLGGPSEHEFELGEDLFDRVFMMTLQFRFLLRYLRH